MKPPQTHVAAPEEACTCCWCGQAIDAGDWLYESQYCSPACYENDEAMHVRTRAYFQNSFQTDPPIGERFQDYYPNSRYYEL